jgi:hypothetical protein
MRPASPQLREDFRRAFVKHGRDPEEARRISASATCAEYLQFFTIDVADYALDQRVHAKRAGATLRV